MSKKLLEIAAEIVHGQSAANRMSPEEIEIALRRTFATLQAMQKAEEDGVLLTASGEVAAEEKAQEKLEPKQSIREDKVICLECGAEMRQLTVKHLSAHGLTPREYKKKWGFPLKQSLSAKMLSKARSKAAKKRGLPQNLKNYLDNKRHQKIEASAAQGVFVAEDFPQE
jgi:predicted transcriptional regulator